MDLLSLSTRADPSEKARDRRARYASRNPQPSYSKFMKEGPKYVDELGRLYRPFSKEDASALSSEKNGTQLAFCVPIDLRGTARQPYADDKIRLWDVDTLDEWTSTVDASYYDGPKRMTGRVVLRGIVALGETQDPIYAQQLIAERPNRKGRNRYF
jgi:hypothetical protein